MLQTVLLAAALVIPMHVVPGTHGEPRLGLDVGAYHFADGGRQDTPEMFGGAFPGIIGIGMQVPPRGACCSSPIPALANGVGRRYVVRADLRAPELTLDPDDAAVQDFDMSDVGPSGWPQGCITSTQCWRAVSRRAERLRICGSAIGTTTLRQAARASASAPADRLASSFNKHQLGLRDR